MSSACFEEQFQFFYSLGHIFIVLAIIVKLLLQSGDSITSLQQSPTGQ